MNIISKLRSKQKMLIIAASLLFGLSLTPASSIAASADHGGYRNNNMHNANLQQGNRGAENHIKHQNNGHHNQHLYADRRYYAVQRHHRHSHNRHRNPHYALSNHHHHHHHHPDRLDLQIAVRTGNFDIVVRD